MSKFRNIRVKKAGGGYRTQRAMVLASGKLKFVKNRGSHGHKRRKRKASHHRRARARKAPHVARRRRRRSHHRSHRRRHGGGGGSILGIVPMEVAKEAAFAAAIGKAEEMAKADSNFILNKLPKFIPQLGWLGNTAVDLYLANKFLVKNPMLGKAAKVALTLAGYQLGRNGKFFSKADEFFTVSGADYLGHDAYIEHHSMGALEAQAHDDLSGVAFDPEVHDALAHT